MTQLLGNVLVIVSAVLAVAFIVTYHWSATWWKTPDGRHVMNFMGVIAAVLVLSTIRIFLGTPGWFEWLRLVVFAGVPYVLYARLRILIRAQMRSRQRVENGES